MENVREIIFVLVIAVLCTHSESIPNIKGIKECCNIVSEWETCHSECLQFASTCPPAVENKTTYLEDYCPELPVELSTCFDNLNKSSTPATPTVPPELAACCEKSSDQNCVDVCLEQALIGGDTEESVKIVEEACGNFFQSPIWSCFLTVDSGTDDSQNDSDDNTPIECNPGTPTEAPEPIVPIHNADWSRLQCCTKTNDTECMTACLLEYTGGRTTESWDTLNLDCKYRPTEEALTACLDDTVSQCLPGCQSQLGFCENFNNRPLTLFRNCHNESDHNAKRDFTAWFTQGFITHPLITVKLRNCDLDPLKTVACAFHLQPCQPDTHSSLICQNDCLSLMRDCSDSDTHTPEEICEILTPTHLQDHCLSLEEFLERSTYTPEQSSITDSPCDSNPCASGFKCIINKECLPSDKACAAYKCLPACKLGLSPSTVFEEIEVVNVATVPTKSEECFGYINRTDGICTFGLKESDVWGKYCIKKQECEYNGVRRAHGEVFELGDDCNFCVCKSGQVNCTYHVCPSSSAVETPLLSCDKCLSHYDPVCTRDQRTLPSICFADCLGYNWTEVTKGACRQEDPCASATCPDDTKCIPNPHLCLTGKPNSIQSCPQYTCENYTTCMDNPHTSLCDKSGANHHSMCDFIFRREKVDYFGYCQDHCFDGRRQTVCGVNGETYESVCHARGVGVAVDYLKECRDIPSIDDQLSGVECKNVKCPDLPYFENEMCTGPVPPGACCEQCGGMMRTIVDNAQLERNIAVLKGISFSRVLARLAAHIDVVDCTLSGYLALDGAQVFLALPADTSSFLNLQLCNNEITRLASLINRRSPVIASDPFLSHLVAANYTHAYKTAELPKQVNPESLTPSDVSSGQRADASLALLTLSIVMLLVCTMAADVWQR